MPYGREVLVESWGIGYDLHDAMGADVLNAETISGLAKESQCHYVIIDTEKSLDGSFEDYDYVELTRVGKYVVYQDTTICIGL
jgi:hypothetical protein